MRRGQGNVSFRFEHSSVGHARTHWVREGREGREAREGREGRVWAV